MSAIRKKNPFIAGLLSFCFPGAGQLYNEEFSKGLILIATLISGIVVIVYTGINMGTHLSSGNSIPQASEIVKIVTAGLIITSLWVYGMIDGFISAQKISRQISTNPEVSQPAPHQQKEGLISLGVVLITFGILAFLLQLGVKLEYLLQYGFPAALIIIGGYLMLKNTGLLKGKDGE